MVIRTKTTLLRDFAEPQGEAFNQPAAMLRAPRQSKEEEEEDSAIGHDEARELRTWLACTPTRRLPLMKRL